MRVCDDPYSAKGIAISITGHRKQLSEKECEISDIKIQLDQAQAALTRQVMCLNVPKDIFVNWNTLTFLWLNVKSTDLPWYSVMHVAFSLKYTKRYRSTISSVFVRSRGSSSSTRRKSGGTSSHKIVDIDLIYFIHRWAVCSSVSLWCVFCANLFQYERWRTESREIWLGEIASRTRDESGSAGDWPRGTTQWAYHRCVRGQCRFVNTHCIVLLQ